MVAIELDRIGADTVDVQPIACAGDRRGRAHLEPARPPVLRAPLALPGHRRYRTHSTLRRQLDLAHEVAAAVGDVDGPVQLRYAARRAQAGARDVAVEPAGLPRLSGQRGDARRRSVPTQVHFADGV